MNFALECIRDRFSCRAFTGHMPDEEKLLAILQAAIQSPSGKNQQPWQMTLVRNAELLLDIEAEAMDGLAREADPTMHNRIQSRGGKLFYHAPCAIFISINSAISNDAEIDGGIASQSITIAAQSLGLASCICRLASFAFAGEKGDHFKERLSFPEGHEFCLAILLGEPKTAGTPHKLNQEKITIID